MYPCNVLSSSCASGAYARAAICRARAPSPELASGGGPAEYRVSAAATSAGELGDYLRQIVADRRRKPREDLISAMIAARDRDDALTDDELVSNCILILLAGHETTTNLIGNGALALLRHPDQAKLLCEDPGLAASAVEECLRYDTPIQVTSRVTVEDLDFRGARFAKGVEVNLLLGAANRDPSRFEDPERFDIRRPAVSHVSFGHGAHFCLGATLARLEGQIALTSLLRRMPRLQLEMDDPPRQPGFVLRGPSSLPVRF
jgi:pimeloyl-[acyl-carrier protein] synthase